MDKNNLNLRLHYFDARGRAECIRCLLHYVGQEFEDVRFSLSEWPEIQEKMPQKTVPVLEVNGKMLPQSRAIMRYLGRLFDLTGRNHWERAIADSILDLLSDFYSQMLPWYTACYSDIDKDELEKLKNDKLIPAIETKLPFFVNYLNEAKSGYYVKSGITFIDFMCSEIFDNICTLEPDLFNNYPEIIQHIQTIHSLPQLKDYISNRK